MRMVARDMDSSKGGDMDTKDIPRRKVKEKDKRETTRSR